MNRVFNLDEWIITKEISDKERMVDVSIYLKYPKFDSLINFSPNERKSRTNFELKEKYKLLLETDLIETYKKIGSASRPSGIETRVSLANLNKIAKLKFVNNIFVKKVSGAKKKPIKINSSFFCVKMTVAIQIEGYKKGMQTYEERMVLVKAKSFEDAYKKVEKQKKDYELPYLNSNGELVRWKIESFDDCYSTGKDFIEEFDEPNGVEVFSSLKKRRLNKNRFWDGNLND